MGVAVTLHPDLERLALLGWKLVPATSTKKGMFKGERYGLSSFIKAATDDLDRLAEWSAEFPHACWKARPQGSGVWFLDVDVPGAEHKEDGVATLRALCDLHGPLPPRPHARSPSGGHLLVFKDTGAPMVRGSGKGGPGIDVLHMDLCAMVSPSRRRGGSYRWVTAPWELNPPPAPEWLLGLLKPPPPPPKPVRPVMPTSDHAMRALLRSVNEVTNAGKGKRNEALHRRAFLIGGFVGAGALDRGLAERELIAIGVAAGQSRSEAQSTVRSGLTAGEQRPIEWGRA